MYKFSNHHIVPKSKNGALAPENVCRLVHTFHVRWHHLFENKTPHEQLSLWMEVNDKVLTRSVQKSINEILEKGEYIYRNGILVPWKT